MIFVKGQKIRPVEQEPGLFVIKLIDGKRGSPDVSLFRAWLQPGAIHSLHTHNIEEAVLFLSGSGVVFIDGKRFEVGQGDAIWIPPGMPHSTENFGGNENLHFIAAFSGTIITSHSHDINKRQACKYVRGRFPTLNRLHWAFRKFLLLLRYFLRN